jgi:hypothetical protein
MMGIRNTDDSDEIPKEESNAETETKSYTTLTRLLDISETDVLVLLADVGPCCEDDAGKVVAYRTTHWLVLDMTPSANA